MSYKAGPVRQLIGGLDEQLSRKQGVTTFSDDPRCVLKFAPVRVTTAFRLSDGAQINKGDLLIDLHCWNDRVTPMPRPGPDLKWAQETSNRLRHSLRLLAAAVVTRPDLHDARACRAKVSFVGRGCSNASVSRIIQRLGFEDVDEGTATLWSRMHDQFENLLLAALVWTHNPEALRRDKMMRERRPVWASRAQLIARHGDPAMQATAPILRRSEALVD